MSTFVNDMKSALWIHPLSAPNFLLLKFMFVFEFCINSSWKAGFQLHILNHLLDLLMIQVRPNFTHVTNSLPNPFFCTRANMIISWYLDQVSPPYSKMDPQGKFAFNHMLQNVYGLRTSKRTSLQLMQSNKHLCHPVLNWLSYPKSHKCPVGVEIFYALLQVKKSLCMKC